MGRATAGTRVLEFAEALAVVLRHAAKVHVPEAERVSLPEAAGRVLAEDVAADRDQPPFDRATRDGFAVRAGEWTAGARLKVAGQVRAGDAWRADEIPAGCAVEIMTGAPVPAGADAVAMLEHAEQAGGKVGAAVGRSLAAGENIVKRGSEARAGGIVLAPGTAMGAAEIAVAAACGRAELAVRKRPSVAIGTTGDELVELDQAPGAQQIRNSNSYALAALVEAAGGVAVRLNIARDTREDVRARIAEGRKQDLLLLSGGVSVGKYDLVEEVLAEFGAEFLFTGVKMQPGKPAVFGRIPSSESAGQPASESAGQQAGSLIGTGFSPSASAVKSRGALAPGLLPAVANQTFSDAGNWTYFFGLPGNPVSTQVTFHCFVEPLLRAMCGAGVAGPKFVQATLGEDVRGKAGLTRVLPARLRFDLERPEVRLVGWQGSGDLTANARANCYAVLPDGRDLRAGDVISVLLR
jgi:molybdopterin molybdotransferase